MTNLIEPIQLEKRAMCAFLKQLIKKRGELTAEISKIYHKNNRIATKLRRELNYPQLSCSDLSDLTNTQLYDYIKLGKLFQEKLATLFFKYPSETEDFTFEYVKYLDKNNTQIYTKQLVCKLSDFNWAAIDLTSLHILYNRLRHNRQHTKDDAKYANSYTYQAVQKRMAVLFPLLQEAICAKGDTNGN